MNDLHNRFRSLDDIPAPDLWREAENRAQALNQRGVRTLSWTLIALMLLLALALSSAVLIGSGIVKLPALVNESASPFPTADALPSESAAPVETSRPATWTAVGSMIDARVDFTATVLPDGKVLVVGGDRGSSANPRALASAELYDLATGTWTATGSMLNGRYRQTATLLPNGKVLVAGGNVGSGAQLGAGCCLATAELYDPSTGTWTPTGSMIDARVAHSATLLLDGTVLVAGGDGALINGLTPGAEVYDPISGSWSATGPMIARGSARFAHTAVLLPDGNVFVVGGTNANAAPELYDHISRSWSSVACPVGIPFAEGRCDEPVGLRTATLLPSGQVLVTGGDLAALIYDVGSGTWMPTGKMIAGGFTATGLPDGRVLLVGGVTGGFPYFSALSSAELYDPTTGAWTATANMVEGRYGQIAVLLPDGRVLVMGGSGSDAIDPATNEYATAHLASAELYDPGS
jgi:hypothetical protein